MQTYRRTQVGWAMVGGLAATFITLVLIRGFSDSGVVLAVLVLTGLLFGTLTVTITDKAFSFFFGIGLIRRRIPLDSIVSFQVVRNRWWHGWGIRIYEHGWLYNVSGLGAIELLLRSGTRLRVGTDEPEVVAQHIAARGTRPAVPFAAAVARMEAHPARRWRWAVVVLVVVLLGAVVSAIV